MANEIKIGNTHTAQDIIRFPDFWIASFLAKTPAPIPPANPPAAKAPCAKP